jgi:hypothetical protein
MTKTRYPSPYQINTRVWLTELSKKLNKAATQYDIPNAELDGAKTRVNPSNVSNSQPFSRNANNGPSF